MRNFLKKIIKQVTASDFDKLIQEAERFPRHTAHTFQFHEMKWHVNDFISVAWQLKEIFSEEQMKFTSASKAPVILDCGSNIGVSAIYFKKLFPTAEIMAFEPDPVLYSCLKKNLEENKISGVEVCEKAVWVNDLGVSFGSDGADGGSVFLEQNKISLPSVRLRDVLMQKQSIDLLKIDIEGAEVDVLGDCDGALSNVKNIFVEYHSWQHLPQKLDLLLNCLSKNGFRYYIQSIGRIHNPFISHATENGMDIQLNIHAIRH